MKAQIHPQWFEDTQVVCASCGNKFTTGATRPKMDVEICYACHPFYTGQMKFIDTAGRVDAFMDKMKKAEGKATVSKADKRKQKREQRLQKEMERPDTLEELRKAK